MTTQYVLEKALRKAGPLWSPCCWSSLMLVSSFLDKGDTLISSSGQLAGEMNCCEPFLSLARTESLEISIAASADVGID